MRGYPTHARRQAGIRPAHGAPRRPEEKGGPDHPGVWVAGPVMGLCGARLDEPGESGAAGVGLVDAVDGVVLDGVAGLLDHVG